MEKLRESAGEFEEARCGLPGCNQVLHIVYTVDQPIYLSFTAQNLGTEVPVTGGCVMSWHVWCEGGHTVQVPLDTGEDVYVFGQCRCDPEDGPRPDAECPHGDLARLRAVLAVPGPSGDREGLAGGPETEPYTSLGQ